MRSTGKKWKRLAAAVALWCLGSAFASTAEATVEVTAVSTGNAPEGARAVSSDNNHTLNLSRYWEYLTDDYRIGAKLQEQAAISGDIGYKTTITSGGTDFVFYGHKMIFAGAATGGSMAMNSVNFNSGLFEGDRLEIYGAAPYACIIGGTPSTSAGTTITTNSVEVSHCDIEDVGSISIYGQKGAVDMDNGSVTIAALSGGSAKLISRDLLEVYGTYSEQGKVFTSHVDIKGYVNIKGWNCSFYGGYRHAADAAASTMKNNYVSIVETDSDLNYAHVLSDAEYVNIYGAKAEGENVTMASNRVILSGCKFNPNGKANIYAAAGGAPSADSPNAVYLSSSLLNVRGVSLHGGDGNRTGALYVGATYGTNGPEKAAPLKADAFASLENFSDIHFYNLDFAADAPALSAVTVKNSGGTSTLHLENLVFPSQPAKELTLLQADNSFIGAVDGVSVLSFYDADSDSKKTQTLSAGEDTVARFSTPIRQEMTNVILDAKVPGTVTAHPAEKKITYDGTEAATLNTVHITGVSDTTDAVPEDWKAAAPGIVVDTDGFEAPIKLAGEKKTLLTASSAMFSDANITGKNKYAVGKDFSDEEAGVTISGTWSQGVYAAGEDNKPVANNTPGTRLVFDAGDLNAAKVTLGAMTWGTPRALTGELDCDFTDARVNASGLSFTGVDTSAAVNQPVDLLTGAKDLAAGTSVTGAEHTQDFAADAGNGASLSATLSGKVSAVKEKIQFTPSTITLNSVDLAGWDGKTAADVPATWTTGGTSVPVIADDIDFAPESLLHETPILNAGAGFFSDDHISGAYKYGERVDFNHTKNSVTLGGVWSRGVKTEEGSNGANLVFINGDFKANSVTFGKMAWGVSRNLTGKLECDFTDAALDASNLVFTGLDTSIMTTSETNLLTGAINLAKGTAVKGENHTQNFDAKATNNENETNGVVLSAALSGKVSVPETGVVRYTVSDVTLNSVDLAGWDGKTAADVPATWTTGGTSVPVIADDIDFAPESLLHETPILNARAGFFSDDHISGAYKYDERILFNHTKNGVTLGGVWSRGVKTKDGSNGANLVFINGDFKANSVTLGKMTWGTARDLTGALNCDFKSATVDASNLVFTGLDTSITKNSSTDLLTGAINLAAGATVKAANPQNFRTDAGNGANLSATLTGSVSILETGADPEKGVVRYTASDVTLNSVALANWKGEEAPVPTDWSANPAGVAVDTDGFAADPEKMAGNTVIILKGKDGDRFFSQANITGANAYTENNPFRSEKNAVALSGVWSRGVRIDEEHNGDNLIFAGGKAEVDAIALGGITWKDDASLRPNAGINGMDYANVKTIDDSGFSLKNPQDAMPGESMTLLCANKTLQNLAAEIPVEYSYTYRPASGVTLDAKYTGLMGRTAAYDVTLTARTNQASKLTFGSVDWTGETALMNRPEAVTFSGADVDTSNIRFMNINTLNLGDRTTLVGDFGEQMGAGSTGTTYQVGSVLQGTGMASLNGKDLIFTARTVEPQEQTHNALMGAGAAMATLTIGNQFIGAAADGLGDAANIGADGVSTYAKMGGGNLRLETGSHVDVRSWNAIIALGHGNEKERSTTQYGAFFEYGSGNYTTHNGALRGDGSAQYKGGGVLAKWQRNDGLYVEGSLRAGILHDDAYNILRDVDNNPYSYENDMTYWGAHLSVGREIALGGGNVLDVYGKYCFNRRNAVSFDAGGHYDLDALTSQVASVGARCTMKRESWNFYGGLAYEYELDGKATGKANGFSIRGADIGGGSAKIELGAAMKPEDAPWSLDLNVTGFAGKKQGVMGGVSATWNF